MKTLILALFFALTPPALAETFTFSKDRTVSIVGIVDMRSLAVADKIVELSETLEPIQIFINSPGGNVVLGMQVMSAIDLAKARGVKVQCFVGTVAASMAFHILGACDERYSLRTSVLLWHPASVRVFNEQVNRERAMQLYVQLKSLEAAMNPRLIRELGISKRTFERYNRFETLHPGASLVKIAPKFLRFVDDVRNAPGPLFSIPREE